MSPRGPIRLRPDPSDRPTYTDREMLVQNGPFASAIATLLPSGDQLTASPEKTKAVVVPGGVSFVRPLPSAPTTNASCGALSPVSPFASGRKKMSLEPSGEDLTGRSWRA